MGKTLCGRPYCEIIVLIKCTILSVTWRAVALKWLYPPVYLISFALHALYACLLLCLYLSISVHVQVYSVTVYGFMNTESYSCLVCSCFLLHWPCYGGLPVVVPGPSEL